jgi:hypothetical protein
MMISAAASKETAVRPPADAAIPDHVSGKCALVIIFNVTFAATLA